LIDVKEKNLIEKDRIQESIKKDLRKWMIERRRLYVR